MSQVGFEPTILVCARAKIFHAYNCHCDRLCDLVVRVLGYRFGGPGSIPGTTRFSEKKKKENK
jgi:hypothetical protein